MRNFKGNENVLESEPVSLRQSEENFLVTILSLLLRKLCSTVLNLFTLYLLLIVLLTEFDMKCLYLLLTFYKYKPYKNIITQNG